MVLLWREQQRKLSAPVVVVVFRVGGVGVWYCRKEEPAYFSLLSRLFVVITGHGGRVTRAVPCAVTERVMPNVPCTTTGRVTASVAVAVSYDSFTEEACHCMHRRWCEGNTQTKEAFQMGPSKRAAGNALQYEKFSPICRIEEFPKVRTTFHNETSSSPRRFPINNKQDTERRKNIIYIA